MTVTIRHPRRGLALVVAVAVLIIINLIVVGIVMGGARDHELTVRRMDTIRSFYAAEAGMNMAIREMMNSADEDLDGGTGTISDDGNPSNDPSLGPAQFFVTSTSGSQTTLTSEGRSGNPRRAMESIPK